MLGIFLTLIQLNCFSASLVLADGGSLLATSSGSILPSAASTEATSIDIVRFSQTSGSNIEPIIYWLGTVLIAIGIKMLIASYSLEDVNNL